MLLEPEELKRLSVMDPSIAKYIEQNPMPPMEWSNHLAIQSTVSKVEKMRNEALGPIESSLSEYYTTISLRDGTSSRLKICKPATPPASGSPLIALVFGGGWVAGTEEQMTPYARGLVRAFGAVVVNISYRLAPQHPFPAAPLDAFDGLKWIASRAIELGADPSKGFIVGGVSAGGNCAAVITRMAQEEKLPHPITGQWLGIPSILDHEVVPEKYKPYFLSREHNAQAPVLDAAGLEALKRHCKWDSNSPLRYPILSKAPMEELPPAYFQADGMDPLRDDALIYEEILKEAGVKTRIDVYPGCPHGHWSMYQGLEVSKKGYADVMMGMGWLLGREISAEEGLRALAIPGV